MSDNVEKLKKQMTEAESRAAKWEKLHTESTIRRELLAAAERGGAYHGPQLLPWLEMDAKLEEVNGQSVVRIVTTNEDGKEVRRTPDEAIADMKKRAAHANLFKATMAAKPTLATPAKIDVRKLVENMSHEQFLKIREEQPELVTVHGPQKHSEKLSRTLQTTNSIVARNTLVVDLLAL